jgi:uncharacterized protein YndB with AHSA1/START domain
MKRSISSDFSIDKENNTISIKREFLASVATVWAAWTESHLLVQWWASKPWKARTKSQDFSVGGFWLYAMVGPDGTEHWSRADYRSIAPLKSYSSLDSFCNKKGKINESFPKSMWTNTFTERSDSTLVSIVITFDRPEDLKKMIEMGFREGITACMENLDALITTL